MSTFCLLLHFVCRSREETAVGRTEEASEGTEEANGKATEEVDWLKRDEKMGEQCRRDRRYLAVSDIVGDDSAATRVTSTRWAGRCIVLNKGEW